MIEARDLHKRFGAKPAVGGVSFTAPDGQVTGLLGPNGAGKTTSLRLVYGLLRPDAGDVLVDGVAVAARPREALSALGVLPDSPGLYSRLTAREHLCYAGELRGLSGHRLAAAVARLVDAFDLHAIADRRTAGFSQGERRKVALARALVHDPRNVVLDEPTNGLDVMATRAVRRSVRELRDAGKCVLFSSHVMQDVAALCDRVVIVAKGRVVAAGTPDELTEQTGHASLEDAFVDLIGTEEGLQ